jgi:hypothetical protein
MLSPDDRRLYSQCFSAPEGFGLDCAVATTFSLDLESFLFAQFCLATSGAGEPEAALRDPIGLLEALHRTAGRVLVFCHAGETNAPRQPQSLYSLLEDSIAPARGRAGGALFHPKLWVQRFTQSTSDQVTVRVVVLSRNLTASRAWDTFICLEGSPARAKEPASAELAELIRALPGLAEQRPGPARLQQLEAIARDVERTSFAAPAPFEKIATFEALGITEKRGFRPNREGSAVLGISPFVSAETLRTLRALAPKGPGTLVSRPEEMAKCPREVIEAWDAYSLDEAANSSADVADAELTTDTADAAPQGLHAKAFVVDDGVRATWWIGSGNLTDPVRTGSSVELMVRLEGKSAKVGVEAFLDAGFRDLLLNYSYASAPADPQEGSRSAVEAAKGGLVEAKLTLRCDAGTEHWSLVLDGAVALPEAVSARCRPVTLPTARAIRMTSAESSWTFTEVSTEAVTALMCFHLEAGAGESKFDTELTLKLPITNIPQDRNARITRSVIKDRAAFLNYLRCLLAGVAGEPLGSGPEVGKEPGGKAKGSSSVFAAGLMEQLLRALYHDPRRLRGLRALLARTSADHEGDLAEAVPEEFREVWAAIEPHLPAEDAR